MDGQRISKTVGSTNYQYHYDGSQLVQMTWGSNKMHFTYDLLGPVALTYNGTVYYYLRNAQGDIIGIANSSGTQVVSYRYDAWGNILDISGSMADTLGQDNPFRYRSYVYDNETGLYYLTSRYYDPCMGRFINADGQVSDVGGDILGYNMFAYCFNNPVNMSDPSGNWPSWATKLVTAVAIVAVTAIVVATVIAAAPAVAGAVKLTALVYGASASTASTLAAATTVGCAAIATGAAAVGGNRAIEAATGTNYGEKLLGKETYETVESSVNFAAALITSVPQTVPYPSTGRSIPNNLKEQVAMNLTTSYPSGGKVIMPYLNDPRMPGWLGWQKYEMHFENTGIAIHYVGNRVIPVFFDFKFKID